MTILRLLPIFKHLKFTKIVIFIPFNRPFSDKLTSMAIFRSNMTISVIQNSLSGNFWFDLDEFIFIGKGLQS